MVLRDASASNNSGSNSLRESSASCEGLVEDCVPFQYLFLLEYVIGQDFTNWQAGSLAARKLRKN